METVQFDGCLSCPNKEKILRDRMPLFKGAVYELNEIEGLAYAINSPFSIYVLNACEGNEEDWKAFVERVENVRKSLEKELNSEVQVVYSSFCKCFPEGERNFLLCKKQVEKELTCVLPTVVVVFEEEGKALNGFLEGVLQKSSVKFHRFFTFRANKSTKEEEMISFLRSAFKEVNVQKVLVFRESDLEDFNRFFFDELENAEGIVKVYVGRFVFPASGKNEFNYLKEVDCAIRGGYQPDGVTCLGVGFKFEDAKKTYVFPLGFHRLVDGLKEKVNGFIEFLKENRNDLVRSRVSRFEGKLANLLVSGNFSERFVKNLKSMSAPGELATFLTKVEICFHQLGDFLEGLSQTSYYEVSQKLEELEKKIIKTLLTKRLVVNDAETFLTLARKVLGDEDYVVEEGISSGRLKIYSLRHFDDVVVKTIDNANVIDDRWGKLFQMIEDERDERKKVWADVYVYEGKDSTLEKGVQTVFDHVNRIGRLYKKQTSIVSLIKKNFSDVSAVLPVSDKNGNFVRVPIGDALLTRLFFVNQVVLPLISEMNYNGLRVNVEEALRSYKKISISIDDVVEHYLKELGVRDNTLIDQVASQVKEYKISAIDSFLKHKDLVVKSLRAIKNKGIRVESEEFWLYLTNDLPEQVSSEVEDVERFKKELLFYLWINKTVKIKQFLEEVLFFAIDGKVHPYYEVDGARTGRIAIKNPAVFRWFDGSYVMCLKCGALYESKDAIGKECRCCGTSRKKRSNFFEIDFSLLKIFDVAADVRSAELTTLAGISRDEKMIDVIQNGDVYCYLGSKVALEDYERVLESYQKDGDLGKRVRKVGKKQSFLIVYGGSVDAVPRDFQSLKKWMESVRKVVDKENAVATLMGKVRFVNVNRESEERLKTFVNTPIQGTTAELFILLTYLLKMKTGSMLRIHFINQDSFAGSFKKGGTIDVDKMISLLEETSGEITDVVSVIKKLAGEKLVKNVSYLNEIDLNLVPYEFEVEVREWEEEAASNG